MPRAIPFATALADLRQRQLLPTSLSSAEIEGLPQWVRDSSFFSARVAQAEILDGLQARIDQLLGGGERGPGLTMDPALFRVEMRDLLDAVSYQPADPRDEGTIKDLRSEARLNVIVRTQEEMATGHGQYLQSIDPDTVDLWPAWELIRLRDSKVKRNWEQRWQDAAAGSGDTDAARMLAEHGRMLARKDSPIWTQLSRFGRPHPPFDFNSGMGVEDVRRGECIELGLIRQGDRIQPIAAQNPPAPQATVAAMSPEMRGALLASMPGYRMDTGGILHAA